MTRHAAAFTPGDVQVGNSSLHLLEEEKKETSSPHYVRQIVRNRTSFPKGKQFSNQNPFIPKKKAFHHQMTSIYPTQLDHKPQSLSTGQGKIIRWTIQFIGEEKSQAARYNSQLPGPRLESSASTCLSVCILYRSA